MSVTATEAPPEIDNLYLDMNGIIHNCTHANDPNLKLKEDEMVLRIFTYLDKLIQIIKPKQLLFMAIDGKLAVSGAQQRCIVLCIIMSGVLMLVVRRCCSTCQDESAAITQVQVCKGED